MHRNIAILILLAGCGRPVSEADVKLSGVGLNPDEIGPSPTYYGGYVEYDWVNFAGGGLTLAALGLASTDEVGPGLTGFKPPYAAVYGLSFIFDEQVPAPDAHHGSVGVPPTAPDACWTNFEPLSYLMASTVEVGDEFVFRSTSEDGDMEFALSRNPEIYPPNPQDIFVYYIGVESWLQSAMTHYTPDVDGDGFMEEAVLRKPNFQHGEEVEFYFAGGVPPIEAPVSAIPRSSASVTQDTTLFLPTRASNLSLSWTGPTYDTRGKVSAESGEFSTCVNFLGVAVEGDTSSLDCTAALEPPLVEDFGGQIYTGPWDTEQGAVTFQWDATGSENETVILNVRFLGPVDETDAGYLVGRVPVTAPGDVTADFNSDLGRGYVTGDLPQGYRSPMACEDPADVEWVFDPTLKRADGDTTLAMQGDPSFNLVEVSCRLADDGVFTLTNDHLASALEYAGRKDAGGAIFYFSRSTEQDAHVPAVRDQEGFKRDIDPIKIRAHSVELGRFWFDGEGY